MRLYTHVQFNMETVATAITSQKQVSAMGKIYNSTGLSQEKKIVGGAEFKFRQINKYESNKLTTNIFHLKNIQDVV